MLMLYICICIYVRIQYNITFKICGVMIEGLSCNVDVQSLSSVILQL